VTTGFLRARRLAARLLAVCVMAGVVLAAAACPRAGHFLILDEPLQPADALIVLAGMRVERWLEAAELYREGLAPAIVLSQGIVEPAETRLRARGIRFPAQTDLVKDALVQMGIPAPAISTFPQTVDNTAEEALRAREAAERNGWKSLIVVTSKYHTRRSRYAFERELKGTGITVQVRGSRFDEIQPDRWWKSRSDFRSVVSELQKLAAYRLGLGR
jgi:uncharacterized SAM-binding protein YcdF (DUF218 family)